MSGPLSQLKILDLSNLLPGPYASMMLADMGADVLRIEAIGRDDMVRAFRPAHKGTANAFLTLNRNKRAMALDLKQGEAVDVVKKLIASHDVLIEQFRPGVMEKLGLDYQTLSEINPKLIYCSITGYGQTGCYKDKAGHDINYLAMSGLASYSGTKKTGAVLSGTQVADIAGGFHHAVMAILAAVIERGISNKGQYLDISMTDAAFTLNGLFGAGAVGADEVDPQLGSTLLNGGHFYDYYQTEDGRYLSVGSLEPKFAELFFKTIGHSEWLSRTTLPDEAEQQSLKEDIACVIAKFSLSHWLAIFGELDVCVEPVRTVSEAANSQLMKDRQMLVNVKTPTGDSVRQIAPALKFAARDDKPQEMFFVESNRQTTGEILTALGYSKEEIDKFIDLNAVR